ncbi:UNKNOWN [Stylonychia lemnae]|uniref:Uncharacterized protein n=1 Tax=Stylonychia lemnae TaxID=5949 RepID=A0A078AI77_STYLE|nr:UNKNOWN [Stylonychia lemnae]|eukprot:CDW80508.1 UNKNOWN [Stylonychia lemnae]
MKEHSKYFQEKVTQNHIQLLVNKVAHKEFNISPNKNGKNTQQAMQSNQNKNQNSYNKFSSGPKTAIENKPNMQQKTQIDASLSSSTSYYEKFSQNKQSPPKKTEKEKSIKPPALSLTKPMSEQPKKTVNPLDQFSSKVMMDQVKEEPKKQLPWEKNNNKLATSTTKSIDQPQARPTTINQNSSLASQPLAPLGKQNLTSLTNLPPPTIQKPKTFQASAWDDDGGWGNDDDDWNFEDIEKPKNNKGAKGNKLNSDSDDGIDYNTLNLNKLSDYEIQKHKKKMDKKYEQNFVKPTDPTFVYDKRKDFKPPASGDDSWDEEDF